jgi:hypothetical protein
MPTQNLTYKFFAAAVLAAASISMIGCGGSSTEIVISADNQDAENQTTSIIPSQSGAEGSPANLASVDVSKPAASSRKIDQTPDGLVRKFMELLQSDKALAAENLLTRLSQMNTTKEELELKSIGGPTAKFHVGEIRYATSQQNVAQVDCKVTDNGGADPFEIDLTWIVKRQKKSWRISGVMMKIDDDATPDLLSFENVTDVRRIKAINDQEVLAEDVVGGTTRQADAGGETTTLK